jgi:integrase
LHRYQFRGQERWMGLGSRKVFSLKEARASVRINKQLLYHGTDPIEARRERRAQEVLEKSRSITFASAAEQYYALHERKWSSATHRAQFLSSLRQHVFPMIGKKPVADITTSDVLRVVEPIWIEKNQTASRTRGRIEAVLDWAGVRGFRTGDNPARWTGHLSEVLPTGGEISKVEHHKALPYAEVAGFAQQLAEHQGVGPKALEFIILSCARTSEVLKARWSEFDIDNKKIWTVPASRMKGRKPHVVPLTERMLVLLKALPREPGDDGLVFISSRSNAPLGKMTVPKLVDAMGYDVTVHGFRATFRTWAGEQTSFAREVIEFCLAHVVGDASERAYWRGDMIEKRRRLMEEWNKFVSTPPRKTGAKPIPIRRDSKASAI